MVQGEVALAHEIERKPGDEEIADVIVAEQADAGSPGRSQTQKFEKARHTSGAGLNCCGLLWLPLQPGKDPKEADEAESDEEGAPAESGHQQATKKHAEARPQDESRGDHGVGQAAM